MEYQPDQVMIHLNQRLIFCFTDKTAILETEHKPHTSSRIGHFSKKQFHLACTCLVCMQLNTHPYEDQKLFTHAHI